MSTTTISSNIITPSHPITTIAVTATTAAATNPTCDICTEDYDHKKHQKITCGHCQFQACKVCCQQFLLSKSNMTCMNPKCLKEWSYNFLVQEFNKTFVKGPLRKHRENIFYETEKALLPEAQIALEEILKWKGRIRHFEIQNQEIQQKIKIITDKINNELPTIPKPNSTYPHWIRHLKTMVDYNEGITVEDKTQFEIYYKEITTLEKDLKSKYDFWRMRDRIQSLYRGRGGAGGEGAGEEGEEEKQRRKFIKPCPSNDCRGFLSTQWKCGLCQVQVCSKCHVEKSKDKEDTHTCDPNDVATAEFLMKDTKSCPKCATAIHKIEGCDQMWCTQCQTAFSWKSNEIIHGNIHNPHYFQWMRRQNLTERNPMDIICGRELDHRLVILLTREWSKMGHLAMKWHPNHEMLENILYLKDVAENRFRVLDMMNHREMRIRYLDRGMDEAEFKRQVFLKYRHNEINREMRSALLLFRDVCTELAFNLYDQFEKNPGNAFQHVENFRIEVRAIQDMVLGELKKTCDLFQIKPRSFNVFERNTTWINDLFPI